MHYFFQKQIHIFVVSKPEMSKIKSKMSLKLDAMKKITPLFIMCLLLINISTFGTSEANTNNYKCLDPLQTYYFSGEYDQVKCIRIDSVKLETDSVYYPFYTLCFVDSVETINQIYFHNYSPCFSSWIGKKMILKPNGDNIFINRFNDSITIKTTALVGEKWEMWHNKQISIEANVISHDTLTFLGLTDSVKTIRLKSVNNEGNPVNFLTEDYTIKLSKYYGLIQTPSFYHFPFKVNTQYDNSGTNNPLIGLSSPKAGFQNLTWKEVYDFEVGDEFHVHESKFDFGNGTEKKIINKIISKEQVDNNFKYKYLRKEQILNRFNSIDENKYTEDTITETILPFPVFDKLPNEPQSNIYGHKELPKFGMNVTHPDFKHILFFDNLFNNQDSILWNDNIIVDGGYYEYYEFRKGLGGPYYEYHPFMWMGSDFSRLVYYQKGNNSWGVPFDKLQIKPLNENSNIQVVFNNQNKTVQILNQALITGHSQISIYDITGKAITQQTIDSETQIIQTNDWQKGIYFYSIKNDEGIFSQGKIIID